jgi:hypothetical protein
MKIFNCLKLVLSLVVLSFSVSGYSDTENNTNIQAADVACRYETKVIQNNKSKKPSVNPWFFWRTSNMVQTQDADGDHGEIWLRTVNDSIQYRKLYHADKTAVEYMPTDMPTNNMSFNWDKLSNMLSQSELDELKWVKKTHVMNRNAEVYKGKIGKQAIEVVWLTDEKLPASIIKKDKVGTIELHLVEIEALSVARKKPLDVEEIANYRHIDATDFGDMENDPFVKKVTAGNGHHHDH